MNYAVNMPLQYTNYWEPIAQAMSQIKGGIPLNTPWSAGLGGGGY